MLEFLKKNIFIIILSSITLFIGFLTFLTFIDRSFIELNQNNLQFVLILNILLLFLLFIFIFIEIKKSIKNDISFFDSVKYKSLAVNTRASACITTKNLEKFLPANVQRIIVKNVLYELALALKILYPNADLDYPDNSLKKPNKNTEKCKKDDNKV